MSKYTGIKPPPGSVGYLSHPSVRVKGTENDFNPVNCVDPRCKYNTVVHLHCPFCIKTEVFYDNRILKVHYEVKHVDKGIEFAGLKILRCCEHCDMVGLIKGEKKFKVAHWHCFKCRNGFNRRDEAIKHYKTHFREPYNTFQIYIAQDVNNIIGYQVCKAEGLTRLQGNIKNYVAKEIDPSPTQNQDLGTPVILKGSEISLFGDSLDEQSDLSSSALMIENQNGQTENQDAIMIIRQNDNILSNTIDQTETAESQQNAYLEKLVSKLQGDVLRLTEEKKNIEMKLQAEIQFLKSTVKSQSEELHFLREKVSGISDSTSNKEENSAKIEEIIAHLKEQHSQLLMEQLDQIKKEVYTSVLHNTKEKLFNDISTVSSDSESYLLPESSDTSHFVDDKPNNESGFISDENSSHLNRPYYVVSQTQNNTQKRKFDDIQGEIDDEEEEPLLNKD